ncbi:hypothetical protein BST61_g1871 [Cercospora zeina]
MPANYNQKFNKQKFEESKKKLFKAPAAKHLAHKWIAMREAIEIADENCIETSQRNPDRYGLHVYTDYWPYAIIDLIGNLCKSADKAFKARDLHKAWATVAALGHYMNHGIHRHMWLHADDGKGVQILTEIIGRTILTALDAIQHVGQLHKESKFQDLGLVMGLFFNASLYFTDFELELENCLDMNWQEAIVGYAMKAEIDLLEVGVADIEGAFSRVQTKPFDRKNGNWKFSSSLNSWWRGHHVGAPFWGGESFNICHWTREERAEYSFDHEDPLKDFPEDLIKKGSIVPA